MMTIFFIFGWTVPLTFICVFLHLAVYMCILLSDVTYDQVWWPILGICALHLTHPKCTHTAVNTHTHTRSRGQPFMLQCPGSSWGFGALLKGTSAVVLRVERVLYIHSPHLQFLPETRTRNLWITSLTSNHEATISTSDILVCFCRYAGLQVCWCGGLEQ